MLGCGRRVARSPFSTSLGCAAWYRPHLEKKMVGVEKPLFPGMLGWLFAAHLCCCSPNVLFWPSSCSVLLGTLWVHFPSCHSPLYFSIQVFCGFLCFFQVRFPVSTSQLLPKAQCSAPGALGCAGGTGCQWDAPGQGLAQHLGTVLPRKVSQTGGLSCLLELSAFPIACGSNIPCGALWLLCAVASLALITNCSSLAAGIFYFELVYSWQGCGGCWSSITCCSAGL